MNAKWGVPLAAATSLGIGALFLLDAQGSTSLPDPGAITPLAPRAALAPDPDTLVVPPPPEVRSAAEATPLLVEAAELDRETALSAKYGAMTVEQRVTEFRRLEAECMKSLKAELQARFDRGEGQAVVLPAGTPFQPPAVPKHWATSFRAKQGADGTVHGRYLQISPEEVPEALVLYEERNWLAQMFDRDGQQALLEGSYKRDR